VICSGLNPVIRFWLCNPSLYHTESPSIERPPLLRYRAGNSWRRLKIAGLRDTAASIRGATGIDWAVAEEHRAVLAYLADELGLPRLRAIDPSLTGYRSEQSPPLPVSPPITASPTQRERA
jgi:hypothetical protein